MPPTSCFLVGNTGFERVTLCLQERVFGGIGGFCGIGTLESCGFVARIGIDGTPGT